MKINIIELEKIISLLLSKLKKNKGSEIEINNDYYWSISPGELYNLYEQPKNITLGQLSDDIQEITRLTKNDDAVTYDLHRISAILEVLSNENETIF